MTKKITKEKAISIKGKDYILIKDRVIFFNEEYQNGSIETQLLSEPTAEMVVFKAIIIPDLTNPTRRFTGHSQATWDEKNYINKTSALENCETSAIGRALANMGIGVLDSIASADEIRKTDYATPADPASDKQLNAICIGLKKLGVPEENCMDTKLRMGSKEVAVKDLDKKQASMAMGKMMNKLDKGQGFKDLFIGLSEDDDPFEKMPTISENDVANGLF